MRGDLPVVGSFNAQPVAAMDAEQTINQFEYLDPLSKKAKMLLATAGLKLKIDFGPLLTTLGSFRGGFVFKNVSYLVVGENIFEVQQNFSFSSIGVLGTTAGRVRIEANQFQVIFVDSTAGYIWDTNTSIFSQITAPGFPTNPIDVAYLDGFFIVPFGGKNEWAISAINNGLVWDAAQFASVTTQGGAMITAVRTLHRRLFIFTETFTEVWENLGLPEFPFSRNNSASLAFGTVSAGSVNSEFDMMFFLSNTKNGVGPIMRVTGVQASPASITSMDYEIANYVNFSDCNSMLYRINGTIFYRLNFGTDDKTWVINATQSSNDHPMWHQEMMEDGSRHIGQVAINFDQTNYFGSRSDGKLYEVDYSFFDNDGQCIPRIRICKHLADVGYNKIRIDRVQLDLKQGDALSNIPITLPPSLLTSNKPVMYLAISRDGGVSYGNEMVASLGEIGQRTFRTIWRKLGSGRDLVFKFSHYNPLPYYVLGGAWDYETGPT